MNTTTIQRRAGNSFGTNTSTTGESAATTRRSAMAYVLPRRFDIHQVDRVRAELDGLAGTSAVVGVDGSLVEMVDLAALAALHGLVTDHPGIRLDRPSVALRATVHFTGHDRVAAAISLDTFVEAA